MRMQNDLQCLDELREAQENHRQPQGQAQSLTIRSQDNLHHNKNSGRIEGMQSLPELIALAEEVARQRIASTTQADIEHSAATRHLCAEDTTKILEILHTRMTTRTTAPHR